MRVGDKRLVGRERMKGGGGGGGGESGDGVGRGALPE